jgi:U1 small nuclear ribonucleoprotein
MPTVPVREGVFPLLQPPLNRLFIPRPKVKYLPPLDREHEHRTGQHFDAVSDYVKRYMEIDKKEGKQKPSLGIAESKAERVKKRREKREASLERRTQEWDPSKNQSATSDGFRTVFVGRLNYGTTEEQLRLEFEEFGQVDAVKLVHDKQGKSRGYAFVEFARERSLRRAYLEADGRKINGSRVVVDIERGRTVKGWKPRCLGGGLGKTRAGPPSVCARTSGRDPATNIPMPESRKRSASPKQPPVRERPRPRYEEYEPGEYQPNERVHERNGQYHHDRRPPPPPPREPYRNYNYDSYRRH